ncbi:MAG: SDR family oxidoreductase [Fidelibacterota bacterium]
MFQGKTAIVTGGARGIGYAIAERFLENRATVYIVDLEFPDSFSLGTSGQWFRLTGDVTVQGDVEKCVSHAATDSGRIDILVNNAGAVRDNVIWKMTEEEFDFVVNVNLKGTWLMCRGVVPIMRKQDSGRIVNISSRAWLGNFGQSNYSASKGGVVSLTRTLALELIRYDITVNAVAPGLIDTPLTRSLRKDVLDRLLEAQPGKKMGHPEDVASAVAFLASPEAAFITGQVIHVDGGKSVGLTSV